MELAFCIAVFVLAGVVKGVVGMGLPTVAIGMLVLVMSPAQASALLLAPSMATNLWQLWAGPALRPLLVRLWPMMVAVTIGTLITTRWMVGSGSPWVSAALGATLILYAIIGLKAVRLRLPSRGERGVSIAVGFVTGLVTGLTGVFVIPAVPYLQTLGLDKESLIQALGLSFTVSTLALGLGLLLHGGTQAIDFGASAMLVLPALLGLALGQWVRQRLSEAVFRKAFFIGLLLLGIQSLVRAFL
ncbi:sulfite exporter TauE/SafE family protein [Stutzerimonas azotifigens]|uniref:Probable membrane transporter protein n=1 Tax=Stutzerimonas azotifigens TaxID=291995 RepID=A0ABR5YX14_9GAMM|nr:sulfite exporter TauE/SafE family protein [Stutzerimonas azotifigens]MBA1272489.1 sulfite exporter TauE/SafE family protein [Stutzerimonas azotifigens]